MTTKELIQGSLMGLSLFGAIHLAIQLGCLFCVLFGLEV